MDNNLSLQNSAPSPSPIPARKARLPLIILNIIFGLGILACPVLLFVSGFAADTPAGIPTATLMFSFAIYYPFIAIASIITSQIRRSLWWALLPLFFGIAFSIVGSFAPDIVSQPAILLWWVIFER